MQYQGFTTFATEQSDGVLTVTFDFPPVNVQGQETCRRLRAPHDRAVDDQEPGLGR